MPKQLIVNADDYGRSPGTSEGILRAYRQGIVTSATAMMNMPGIEEWLHLACQEPGLGLGVHLVFTTGRPLCLPEQVPSLVDVEGQFLDVRTWWTALERLQLEELWAEWQAQLSLFRKIGGEPDHLDCHHFVHLHPPIFETYLKLADHEGLPVRVPFLAEPEGDEKTLTSVGYLGVSPEMVSAALEADRAALRKFSVRRPDNFCGAFFDGESLSLDYLLSVLENLSEGVTELMVHPGLADEILHQTSSYSWQRELELQILCHPTLKRQLEKLGIRLVNYGVFK